MSDRVEFYADARGEHRWRYIAENGNVMADSSQGYARREDALHGAAVVIGFAGVDDTAPVLASALEHMASQIEIVDLEADPRRVDREALGRDLMTAFVGNSARAANFGFISEAWLRTADAAVRALR